MTSAALGDPVGGSCADLDEHQGTYDAASARQAALERFALCYLRGQRLSAGVEALRMGSPWPMALVWDLAGPTIAVATHESRPARPSALQRRRQPSHADGWPRLAATIATWDAERECHPDPAGRRMMDSRGASGHAWFVFPRTLTPALGNSAYFPEQRQEPELRLQRQRHIQILCQFLRRYADGHILSFYSLAAREEVAVNWPGMRNIVAEPG